MAHHSYPKTSSILSKDLINPSLTSPTPFYQFPTAMDSLFQGLKSAASGHQDQDSHQKPDQNPSPHQTGHNPSPHQTDHKPSATELLSSAKMVADAAKSTMSHESDKVDKYKVAAASADLLDAGQRYGKLDENTGLGKYVEKAEDYLKNYSHGHGGSVPTGQTGGHGKPNPEQHEGGHEKKESESGGIGDYAKMAQGFFNK